MLQNLYATKIHYKIYRQSKHKYATKSIGNLNTTPEMTEVQQEGPLQATNLLACQGIALGSIIMYQITSHCKAKG